jgi:hypothetical protein
LFDLGAELTNHIGCQNDGNTSAEDSFRMSWGINELAE